MKLLENLQRRLYPLLAPLGRFYAWGMARRRTAHALGRTPATMPHAPCVSVGNIALGGSGKTPLVGWLVRWAVERELRPCVLTRGYRGRPPRLPLLVTPDAVWRETGDEPLLLARRFPQAHVLVDPERARAVDFARTHLAPKIFIMDDGMQHLRLHRHLDLILLRLRDFTTDWGRVLPAGPWREGPSALRAGAAFLVKAEPEAFLAHAGSIEKRMAPFGRPVFSFSLRPQGLYRVEDGAALDVTPDDGYVFVSGLGDNQQAAATAQRFMGRAPVAVLPFRDHHVYGRGDVERIRRAKEEHGAATVICTEKDAVKLAAFALPWLHALRAEVAFGPALFTDMPFALWWEERWQCQPHVTGR